jgi:hypothetical protein
MKNSRPIPREQLRQLLLEVLNGLADDLGLPARAAGAQRRCGSRGRGRRDSPLGRTPGSRLYCTFCALGSASRPSSIRR